MTEAMPFLQKTILLSYDPRPFGQGDFLICSLKPIPALHELSQVLHKLVVQGKIVLLAAGDAVE